MRVAREVATEAPTKIRSGISKNVAEFLTCTPKPRVKGIDNRNLGRPRCLRIIEVCGFPRLSMSTQTLPPDALNLLVADTR